MTDKQPDREPDGQFDTFQTWVNKATSWIGGTNPACFDAKGRRCRIGGDFMRARDEGTFPVYYWFGAGDETPAQQRKSQRLAAKKESMGMTDARIEAATLALLHSNNYEMPGFSTEDLQKALVSEHSGHGEILFTCKRCLCHMAQRQAKAMLEAADAVAWRPIESAPRDGTRFMIRKTTGHICVAFFDDGEWYGDDWYCVHHDEYITHWQPLPAPPNDDVKS